MPISRGTLRTGATNPRLALSYLYRRATLALSARLPVGTHVLDREWDVLVVLDTCRVDALRALREEYEFLTDVESVWSVGGSSPEWIAKTFDASRRETLRDTAYVTANGFAKVLLEDRGRGNERMPSLPRFQGAPWNYVDAGDVGRIEHVWKYEPKTDDGVHHQSEGNPPPRYVTDRGIAVGRDFDFDRVILHYIQPHYPYFAGAVREGRDLHAHEEAPFDYLRDGGDFETVFEAYLDELRHVLDSVSVLLQNVDGTVVLTADHGEAFGEFGAYGHRKGSFHPEVRRVPWVSTTATDTGHYQPTFSPDSSPTDASVAVVENLDALGYL